LPEKDDSMKPLSQGTRVSLLFRIMGILCIVLLVLVLCLVGTVFVAFIVGLIVDNYFLSL
jgi:hypothetical protein